MNPLYSKASWYRHRLSSMSAPEVFYRLGEAVRRRMDVLQTAPAPRDYGPFSPIPRFRENLETQNVSEGLLSLWKEELKQAQNGDFFLLNQKWPKTLRDQRWHRDPVTGKFWPREPYGFQINYRHNAGMGDAKYVWELNRLQYLQHIAAFALKTQNRSAALFCLEEIDNWIDNNPPYRGINWASGIEVAMRIVSFLIVGTFIGEHMTSAQRSKLWASVQMHAQWLERYPSKFSSANNHRAAEGLALFLVGAICPQLPLAPQWKSQGWAILTEAAEQLIYPYGVGAEQAVAYTAITLEMLLLGLHVAQAQQMEIPSLYIERIMRGGEFLRWITDTGGNQPRIGDDDNGCVIGAYQRSDNYINSVLGCVAAVANRSDLVPPNLKPSLRQILFGPPPEAQQALRGLKHLEYGGYTVGRHQMNGHDVMIVFDHGPLGYLSIAAHGHADALSIWLHIDDQPVFVDAGTYLYHSGDAWRDYFRSTSAHNTLNIDGLSASRTAGAFNWAHKANVTVREKGMEANSWYVEAEQDGYLKNYGLLHRRRLDVQPESGFFITDQLVNFGSEDVELNFLLHPALSARIEDDSVVIYKGDQSLLRIESKGPLLPKLGLPGTPECGWYSPRFGEKQQTTRIMFAGILTPWRKSVLRFAIDAA